MAGKFSFFESYYEAAKMLPEAEQGPFLMAVCAYAFDGVEPDLDGAQALAFVLIKPNIDASMKKSEAGRRGGAARQPKPCRSEAAEQPCRQDAPKALKQKRKQGGKRLDSTAESMLASTVESTSESKLGSTAPSDKDMDRELDRDMEEEEDGSFSLEKNSHPRSTSDGGAASAGAEPPPSAEPHCPLCGSRLPQQDGTAMWWECPTCGAIKSGAVVWR